jgi:hypothetical protein
MILWRLLRSTSLILIGTIATDLDALFAVEEPTGVLVHARGIAFVLEQSLVRGVVVDAEAHKIGHENVEAGIHDADVRLVVDIQDEPGYSPSESGLVTA